ncbi:PEP-CTERM sorting domain-containing protein [Simiduia agarivorans]|uniref:PEP-CTERM protein-sorting domain-containing protein n=1 Tax=Simiduia agarivorans (strain DSM 21679 / JCM 13881 / BCRC 17597 / SA1) TaxID=1117647 RepID=K4KKY4_SIMAS|nr:PEP-CTERM sorting domain-containing protein [Simiduia agarivorans]AFU99814.1 hypothetical protein M5M_13350 [Simiduia agarivorans SA1 = DSM 21679]
MNRRGLNAALLLAMGLVVLPVWGEPITLAEQPPQTVTEAPEYPWLALAETPQPEIPAAPLFLPANTYPAPFITHSDNVYVPEPGALSLFVLGLVLVLLARIWRARQRAGRKNKQDV